jgi:integrase
VIGAKAQEVLNEFKGKDTDIVFRPQQAIEEFTVTNYGEDATVRKVGEKYSAFSVASAIRTACEKAFLCPEMLMTRALRRKLPGETSKQRTDRKKQAADWRRKYCWHPNQLRHNAATDARGRAGVDAAQVILGHSSVKTTEIYAETNIDAAIEYARKWG